jgi:mannose-1-phosphate guanylyltransferase
MQSAIKSWLGEDRPKQFCAFDGKRCMLQRAHDLASAISGAERIVTVIGSGHQSHLDKAMPNGLPGKVLEQPMDRGTLPAIFLAATYAYERDPQSCLLVMPSDFHVAPENRFIEYGRRLVGLAARHRDRLVLLAAEPGRAEMDFGWIEPDYARSARQTDRLEPKAMPVRRFHEKPDANLAQRLMQNGALWNTMIMAVQVEMLRNLGWKLLPELMEGLDIILHVLRARRRGEVSAAHEAIALAHVYRKLPQMDFSGELMPWIARQCLVLPMPTVQWEDWGRPERVMATLGKSRKTHHNSIPAMPYLQEKRRRSD